MSNEVSNNTQGAKLCPMAFTTDANGRYLNNYLCNEECAWWCGTGCAVVVMANALAFQADCVPREGY